MPKYIKEGHVIFASERAYNALYSEAGYLPYKEEKEAVQTQDVPFQEKQEGQEAHGEEQDDYEDDFDDKEDVEIDDNEAMPLIARVNMLSYEDLKAKAKELNIPKYANTKRDELVNLVVAALEEQQNA